MGPPPCGRLAVRANLQRRGSQHGPAKELQRKFPAPQAPNVIALEKKTGRLVATDDLAIAERILHGSGRQCRWARSPVERWSSTAA